MEAILFISAGGLQAYTVCTKLAMSVCDRGTLVLHNLPLYNKLRLRIFFCD